MYQKLFCSLALAAITAPLSFAAPAEWGTDLDAAKSQAARENKAILIDFTGSDWCGWCIKLRKEVLDTPAFREFAQDKFVLLEVDMPRGKKLPPELAQRNKDLCKRFSVNGYPTILVISPQEDVLGGFVGGGHTVDSAKQLLAPAFDNLANLRNARAAEGGQRAKALSEIYKSIPKDFRRISAPYLEEIAKSDPSAPSPAAPSSPEEDMENFIAELHHAGSDYKKALALIESQLAKAEPQFQPDLLRLKALALTMGAESEDDIVKAKQALNQALSMLGYSHEARNLRAMIDKDYADTAAVFKRVLADRKAAARYDKCGSPLQQLIARLSHADDVSALQLIEDRLDERVPEETAELLRLKATVLERMADSLLDLEKAKSLFLQSADYMGDCQDAKNLRDFIDSEFKDMDALLQRVRAARSAPDNH